MKDIELSDLPRIYLLIEDLEIEQFEAEEWANEIVNVSDMELGLTLHMVPLDRLATHLQFSVLAQAKNNLIEEMK